MVCCTPSKFSSIYRYRNRLVARSMISCFPCCYSQMVIVCMHVGACSQLNVFWIYFLLPGIKIMNPEGQWLLMCFSKTVKFCLYSLQFSVALKIWPRKCFGIKCAQENCVYPIYLLLMLNCLIVIFINVLL